MIPLRDNIPSRTTPFVNYTMIGLCVVAFLTQLRETPEGPSLIEQYGMIPARVSHPDRPVEIIEERRVMMPEGVGMVKTSHIAAESPVPPWMTMLTCIFLHGGWMHIIGNMLFLNIFGDNVEDRFGHVGYLVFYLACGVAASASHFLTDPNSTTPTIGASGAIAGVMGAYMYLYPRAKVLTAVPIFYLIQMVVLPAPLFLGIWFVIQFFQGTLAITTMQPAGVAWWAHIGGFAVGFVVAWLLGKTRHLRPAVEAVRPNTERSGTYRVALRPPRRW